MTTKKKTNPNKAGVQQANPSDIASVMTTDAIVAPAEYQPSTQQPAPPINPLMEKIRIPGQTYQIPSQGLFYANSELADDVVNGEVHVYPMTAIDEIVIKTPDKLFSGDAVKDVFRRCIPSILKPTELFQKDVDFLMVCLRQVSYGETFDITHVHDCEDAKSNDYAVKMAQFIKSTKHLDPTGIQKQFETTLDNGQHVKLHPIRYKDVLMLMQVFDEDLTPKMQQDRMADTLSGIVCDVDGITDVNMIREWLINIPVKWAKQLSKAIDNSTKWGPDFSVKAKCKDCGELMELTLPMNPVSFFT